MLLSFLLYLVTLHMFNLLTWNIRGIISSTLSDCALLDKSNGDVAVISENELNNFVYRFTYYAVVIVYVLYCLSK